MEKWVTKELAEYAVGARFEGYPQEVIDAAKILLLDNIGPHQSPYHSGCFCERYQCQRIGL
jgi:2-methylcitrate dehydratase PrpD